MAGDDDVSTSGKQYDALLKLPNCTCEAAKDIQDHNNLLKLMQFLMVLDDGYKQIRSNILTIDPLPIVKNAFSILSREESHRHVNDKKSSDSFVFFSNMGREKGFTSGGTNFNNGNVKSVSNQASESVGTSAVALTNDHHPNGTKAKVIKIGDMKIFDCLVLYDVLVVPEYTVSLLSVYCMLRDSKLFVSFNESTCYIHDLKCVRTLVTGSQVDGLYILNSNIEGNNSCVTNVNSSCVSKSIWHDRLGHPSDHVLNILKGDLKISKIGSHDHCEVCHKAKQTKDPFLLSDHVSYKLGQLVHMHVWGPYKIVAFFCAIWSENVLLVDYSNDKKVINCIVLIKKKLVFSRDVKVYVHIFPFRTREEGKNNTKDDGKSSGEHSTPSETVETNTAPATSCEESFFPEGNQNTVLNPPTLGETADVKRSSRKSTLPPIFGDYVIDNKVRYDLNKVVDYSKLTVDNMCFVNSQDKISEPNTYWEACKDPKDPNWIEAMNLEIEALHKNGSWIMSAHRKVIGSKWVYKIKYTSSGEIDRYKARLLAKGFNQSEGIDFNEKFSPVVKMVHVSLDINNAFLYGDLKEDACMTPPLDYYNLKENKVCKLVKSLYGVKQAPKKWNEKLIYALVEFSLNRVRMIILYLLRVEKICLLVYVDDIVLTRNNVDELKNFKTFLSSKFKIKDLGALKYLLGIEVLKVEKGLCLSQRKYYLELLYEFGLTGSKLVQTPIESNIIISKSDIPVKKINNFHKLVDCHMKFTLRLLRYLKKSPGNGILVDKTNESRLKAFVDSDWGKVSWKSKKQTTISGSLAEAEYRAFASIIKLREGVEI
ncbi:uncharacterized protein [Rutidosis leptorrhynchoides]|uniref:uncharacterized protein n=1 Tax=Rutidosis leptorrhynchoides TaxID=125765 RepID=UPI003A990DA8